MLPFCLLYLSCACTIQFCWFFALFFAVRRFFRWSTFVAIGNAMMTTINDDDDNRWQTIFTTFTFYYYDDCYYCTTLCFFMYTCPSHCFSLLSFLFFYHIPKWGLIEAEMPINNIWVLNIKIIEFVWKTQPILNRKEII